MNLEMQPAVDPAFGKRIRRARQDMDLTLRELAAKVGVSSTHLTRIELAQRKVSSIRLIHALSEVLNIPYDELRTLAGPEFMPEEGSALQQAFPGVETPLQAQTISSFAEMISGAALTQTQSDQLLEQCRAYIYYCKHAASRPE